MRKIKSLSILFVSILLFSFIIMAEGYYIERYAYDANGYVQYVGRALSDTAATAAGWQIYKLTYDANNRVVAKIYANGSVEFKFKWSQRATYTY